MRMIRPTAPLVGALSFLVLAASAQFAFPAAAQGATQQVSVPGTLVISTANNPANLGACGTLVFYEWSDVPNTTSATVNYTKNGTPLSETAAGPSFHDALPNEKPPRYAPPGRHWISVGWSYAAGGSTTEPNLRCQNEFEPKIRAAYAPTATVVLTVEVQEPVDNTNPKACADARKNLKVRNKAVSRLLGTLKNAEGKKAKARIRGKLAKAKRSRAKAVQKVAADC